MKILLDITQRVFLIKYLEYGISDVFCNLDHIPKIIPEIGRYDFKIYHYWNTIMQRFSRKEVNEMLLANHIQYKIK